ncbi:hypothetical protein V1512DRAFT_266785 [Lipomyces arxii]|uniref:uncharacterized protein n=1 Tax=Lipomyces arxii TaxID=56418 RepID=UPI0034CFBB11
MSKLTNDDFRKLMSRSITSSSGTKSLNSGDQYRRKPGHASKRYRRGDNEYQSSRDTLTSQTALFGTAAEKAPEGAKPTKSQYRDRASERRQGREDEGPNARKGLDFELLARAKWGEDVYGVDGEREVDDPDLDRQLDDLLDNHDLQTHEVESARSKTKSKAELLLELRQKINEKPKARFKPIGKAHKDERESGKRETESRSRSEDRHRGDKEKRKVEKEKRRLRTEKPKIEAVPPVVEQLPEDSIPRNPKQTSLVLEPERAMSPPPKPAYLVLPDKPSAAENIDTAEPVPLDDDSDGGNIFDDVGIDYDPLADLEDEDSASDGDSKPVAQAVAPAVKRNYFGPTTEPNPETAKPAPMLTELKSQTTKSIIDVMANTDLQAVLSQVRASKRESESLKSRGLMPLQAVGGDYDIDLDLGGEGRWIDDDEEDLIGKKKSKKRKT